MNPQKPIIINAFHGLGDIIFSIPIYRDLIAKGHTIIHPYLDVYGPIWKHWPEIAWIPKRLLGIDYNSKTDINKPDYRIIPMRWQEKPGAVMRSKYDYMDMDFMDWRKVTWIRDIDAENALFDLLGIKEGEPYVFINTTFQHDYRGKVNIGQPAGIKVVYLKQVTGYTLLDWGKVLENAAEIHTVSTSVNYLLDCDFLNIKCPMHIYPRHPKEGFSAVDYLFKKQYTYHND